MLKAEFSCNGFIDLSFFHSRYLYRREIVRRIDFWHLQTEQTPPERVRDETRKARFRHVSTVLDRTVFAAKLVLAPELERGELVCDVTDFLKNQEILVSRGFVLVSENKITKNHQKSPTKNHQRKITKEKSPKITNSELVTFGDAKHTAC